MCFEKNIREEGWKECLSKGWEGVLSNVVLCTWYNCCTYKLFAVVSFRQDLYKIKPVKNSNMEYRVASELMEVGEEESLSLGGWVLVS